MLISVITIVKNDHKNIKNTLLSVINQKIHKKYYEYIVIDGNSTDGTKELINNFDTKICFFSKSDKNLYHAINNALKIAKGDYIVFLHSGDLFYDENCLESIKKIIFKYKKKLDLICYGVAYFNKKKENIRVWKLHKNGKKKEFYNYPHTGMVTSKKIFKKIGFFNDEYSICADTDFLIRLFNLNINIFHSKDILVKMLSGGLSNSYKNLPRKIYEDLKIFYVHFKYKFLLTYFKKIIFKLQKNKFFF